LPGGCRQAGPGHASELRPGSSRHRQFRQPGQADQPEHRVGGNDQRIPGSSARNPEDRHPVQRSIGHDDPLM